MFLGIIYSTLHHQFVISGSVTGHAIFLSSAENYGQSLKCGLNILGLPRIIYFVRKIYKSSFQIHTKRWKLVNSRQINDE